MIDADEIMRAAWARLSRTLPSDAPFTLTGNINVVVTEIVAAVNAELEALRAEVGLTAHDRLNGSEE